MRTLEEIDREVFGAGKEPGEQQSVEWLMARVGHVTASRFKDVMDRLKNGTPGAKRTAYLWEVVIERITQSPVQHYESTAMSHGIEHEPRARMATEARTGAIVMETGFLHHPSVSMVGGSPDGLIDDDGGIEIKCPFNSAHHLACWLSGMPTEHVAQVQGLMWITGRAWWNFVSYDPRLPEPLDLFVQRIPRDEDYITRLANEVEVFLGEVAELLDKLNARSGTGNSAGISVLPLSDAAAGTQ